jgi:hypothetical protein
MVTYNTGLRYWFTTQITGELGMAPDTALALRKVYGNRFTVFTVFTVFTWGILWSLPSTGG